MTTPGHSTNPEYDDPNDPRWPDDAQRRAIEDEAGPGGNGPGAARAAIAAGWDPDDDPIVPTRAERAQGLFDRARDAQDRLGWADPADHREVTYATVDLARVVTDLARELRSLAREAL